MTSDEDSVERMRGAVLKAMSYAGLTPSAMAAFMNIPLAQFSHQMQRGGREHLSFWRLALVENAKFWESLLGDLQDWFIAPRMPGQSKAVDALWDLKLRMALASIAATQATVAANRAYLEFCAELEQQKAS